MSNKLHTKKLSARVSQGLIHLYKNNFSNIISKSNIFFGIDCKFYPTCSDYFYQAVEKYGLTAGFFIWLKRFARCNPFSKGGADFI